MSKEIQQAYYGQDTAKKDIKAHWWAKTIREDQVYQHINGVVTQILSVQSWRVLNNIRYARLYANYELLGFYGTMFARAATLANMPLSVARISLNVCKSVVDSAASKIAKNRPKPMFLTSGGDWTLKNRAQKLTKYISSAFEDEDVYEKGQRSFVDSGVFGTGVVKIYKDKAAKKVCVDRIMTDEIIVDDADGMYSTPRNIYQQRYVDRQVLIEMFPDHKMKIKEATGGIVGDIPNATSSDMLLVREAWHLPSVEGAGDGRHAIVIENATLFYEKYEKDYFPFAFLRWTPKIVGFFGSGIIEEIVGIQLEINKLMRNIQLGQGLACIPRVFLENSSQVNSKQISNEVGAIIKYTGTMPVFATAQGMPPEIYNYLTFLIQKAYEQPGISQLTATSKKPEGLDSGVALREYNDIETERFILAGQRYEQFYMDIAKIMVDLSKDLDKELKEEGQPGLSMKVKNGKVLDVVKWSDVNLHEDKYLMQVFPTSLLPSLPAGRLQTVQELIQSGFIGKEQGLALLDFPDLESFMSLQTAAVDDISMLIEDMIEKGSYQNPEPFMNLPLAISMTQSAYLRGKTEKVPEERLELLRRFIDDCQTLLKMAASANQPPAPMAPGGAPIAQPEAPPTSDLMPVQTAI